MARATRVRCYLIGGAKRPPFDERFKNNLESLYSYARWVVGGRWKRAEKTIAKDKDSGWAFMYARYVIRGRWPEAEKNIAKNATWAYLYAREVIGGRWPKGEKISRIAEKTIAKSSWALDYENLPGDPKARP